LLRFETIEGPIDDGRLQQVCELYGAHVDSRYRDLPFVRTVFNDNPAGRSYHVFALDGDRAVGCYAIIPFTVVRQQGSRRELVRAGKAEALFLDPSYRSARGPDRMLPGLQLMTLGHTFARQHGLELLFSLPDREVGQILRATGFKILPAPLDHRHFLLNPGSLRQLRGGRATLAAGRALGAVQRGLDALAGVLRRTQVEPGAPKRFPTLAGDNGWSVDVSEDTLRWWRAFGYVEVLTVDGDPGRSVMFTRGREAGNSEILDWTLAGSGALESAAVLHRIIEIARRDGTLTVSFANDTAPRPLQRAATLLGFVRRKIERTIYVSSKDPFFHDPARLRFNWLFSI